MQNKNIFDHFNKMPESLFWQLPGYFHIKDYHGKYVVSNKNHSSLVGFKTLDEIIGKTDWDIKCEAAKFSECFREQDLKTKEKNLTILDIHRYADGKIWAFYVTKGALYDPQGHYVGVACQKLPLAEHLLIKILTFFRKNEYKDYALSYVLSPFPNSVPLTSRQGECLYYMLRGKTAKQIASILAISPRTVTDYIEHIKYKFNCHTKPELIDKAISLGLFHYIPESLIFNDISQEI